MKVLRIMQANSKQKVSQSDQFAKQIASFNLTQKCKAETDYYI